MPTKLTSSRGTQKSRVSVKLSGPPGRLEDLADYREELRERLIDLDLPADFVDLAWELVQLEPTLSPLKKLALLVITLISIVHQQNGSTRVPINDDEFLRRSVDELLGSELTEVSTKNLTKAIKELLYYSKDIKVIGRGANTYAPLLVIGNFLYQYKIYKTENSLARKVAWMLCEPVPPIDEVDEARLSNALQELKKHAPWLDGKPITLSSEQEEALSKAIRARLTIVSGRPGSGKTFLISSLVRLLVRLGFKAEQIALTAPTGKAADRMTESLIQMLSAIEDPDHWDRELIANPPQAQTLHRLLGYSPNTRSFLHHRYNPLPASIIIVDEVSMVDLILMERLAQSLSTNARLILVGDADQLPSVSAGDVLRELRLAIDEANKGKILTSHAHSTELRVNYRQHSEEKSAQSIATFADAVRSGDTSLRGAKWRVCPEQLENSGVEILENTPENIQRLLEIWFNERDCGNSEVQSLQAKVYPIEQDGAIEPKFKDDLKKLFTRVARSRILCVTRSFPTGVDAINSYFHARTIKLQLTATSSIPYAVGEPIIIIRNDYTRGLFNGDQGIILRVRRQTDAKPFLAGVFAFGNDYKAFAIQTLEDSIELSHAITVHKAQGSEYDSVLLVFPLSDIPLLTRELVYTAVTRARRSVVIVADADLLKTTISRKIERFSGLSERILESLEMTKQ